MKGYLPFSKDIRPTQSTQSTEVENLRKQVAELEMYKVKARLHIQRMREKIESYKSVSWFMYFFFTIK